ncbi:hypothetical protein F0P96_06890 [Hymenobacter busanensis]|uniref:Uncharacterized protein n=1 Tax=Hymenobacter busanensis TaxID=2607656 RepID=A0A7L4ZZR2_9BACT|nr:hypothetical protein [Hymenobacter busanensis]KAA9338553.1 hypothetical protein F0P96_06890 [Hymenobacter busanensis]QHJ09019.1 hypothetical protein GUY19_17710 [Hymenobacter busanensis]
MKEFLLAALVLGVIIYLLGWRYTLVWLGLCALAGAWLIPAFYKNGCKGNLCGTWALLMPFVWLGLALALLLIRLVARLWAKAKAAREPHRPQQPAGN